MFDRVLKTIFSCKTKKKTIKPNKVKTNYMATSFRASYINVLNHWKTLEIAITMNGIT